MANGIVDMVPRVWTTTSSLMRIGMEVVTTRRLMWTRFEALKMDARQRFCWAVLSRKELFASSGG
jgi:hypothetical protein